PVVLCGSQFPDDGDGDYLYAVLSKIMENTKYYARVALGAYSNPMLYVHPDFKCILAMDEDKLEHTDPPLLNRFEKQRLTINDILSERQKELCEVLLKWVHQISKLQSAKANEFNEKDIFIGFDKEETVQSLRLIAIASLDGIVRARQSILNMRNPQEIIELNNSYFNSGLHDDIESCLRLLLGDGKSRENKDGQLIIVNTFSNINTDVKSCLDALVTCQVDKLSTFKTEAQLQDRIKHFWLDSNDELLVLQCDLSTVNFGCIKLAKFIIEQIRTKYLEKKRKVDINIPIKHACIILHIHREQKATTVSFDFICGWNQITVGTLTPEEENMQIFMQGKITNVMNSVFPFEEILEQELLWCLLCIKYPSTLESVEHIKYLVDEIPQHSRFIEVLKQRTLKWLNENISADWQLQVASDKKILYLHSSFASALRAYVRIIVRKYIAKLLCVLERLSALKTLLNLERKNGDNHLIEFWYQMFNDDSIIDIETLMDAKPDGYPITNGPYSMEFPFSFYIIKQINNYEKLYLEDVKMLEDKKNIDNVTGNLSNEVLVNCFERHLKKSNDLYYKDFLTFISSGLGGIENCKLIDLLLLRRLGKKLILNPIRLHTYWWAKSDIIIAELQLAKLCSSITNELDKEISDDSDFKNSIKDLSDLAIQLTLDRFHMMNDKRELQEWQIEASQVIHLCSELSTDSSPFLHLLNICNDLVSKKIVYPNHLSTIINLGRNYDEIIPLESPDRLYVYEQLFAQAQSSHFTAFTIHCIFRSEEKDWFSTIIRNANEVLNFSSRLNIINRQLERNHDSQLAALCCDVIQKGFFARAELQRLKGLFKDAIQVLCAINVKPLQLVCAIALLKQFVDDLWSSATLDKAFTEPIKFNFIDSNEFMFILNELMQKPHPLIQSLKFYFLKNLRARSFTMSDLKQFFNLNQTTLPWLSDLPWNKDDNSRLPLNPYFMFKEYDEAEDALNKPKLKDFLKKLESYNKFNLRISFIGAI
ncbi:6187_t:CDS:2, partial [Racocetra fulgida]